MRPGRPVSSYGGRFLDPNAHRCLRSMRTHLWHAWTCLKSAARHQFKNPGQRIRRP